MRLRETLALGQSVWVDDLRLHELKELIDEGLGGVTANPTTFEKAFASGLYDERLRGQAGKPEEIYETLAIEDIQGACDLFRGEGLVSLEVSPRLAYDTAGTIEEGRRLWRRISRSNAMIKVPGTSEGMPAIEELTSQGVNVNVTLLFSLDAYRYAAEAYMRGLERLIEGGGDPSRVRSVASFFLSRIDTAVDAQLSAAGYEELLGKTAIANAKVAFAAYQEMIQGPRWKSIAAWGGRPQRLLWASTGVKNPRYPKLYYVEALIGRDTVDTMPPETLDEFRRHGRVAETLPEGLPEARRALGALSDRGVNLAEINEGLVEQGVELFNASFDKLLHAIASRLD